MKLPDRDRMRLVPGKSLMLKETIAFLIGPNYSCKNDDNCMFTQYFPRTIQFKDHFWERTALKSKRIHWS